MISLEIDSLSSNFTSEIIEKSRSSNSFEYNINFNFEESFSNSPELIFTLNTEFFEN